MNHYLRLAIAMACLLALVVLLPACSLPEMPDPVTEGTVQEKRSEPGEWETKTKKSCTGTGLKKKCKTKTSQEWDDPDFELLLESCEEGDTMNPECDSDWVEVNEAEYNSVKVGDYFKPKEG